MVSTIDVTKPVYGSPTTQSVRDNFTIAAEEITELQRRQVGGAGVISGNDPPNDPAEDSLWWDSIGCQLYVFYNDGTSKQWVPATSVFASSNYSGVINVRDYGAAGDGIVDDTAAFQAAFDALANTTIGGVIYLPEADYKISAQLTIAITTQRLTIRSDGTHGARLHFTNSASAGIAITVNSVPTGVWLSGGSSIHIENITGVVDWSATSAGKFISITNARGSLNRPMPPGVVIKRVAGIASDNVAGWANLICLQDCIICYLSEIFNWCSTPDIVGNAVTISSTAKFCVSFRIDRLRQQRGGTALIITDNIQGVYVHEMETVGTQQSISWIAASSAGGVCDNLIITNSQLSSILGEIVTDYVDSISVSNSYILGGSNVGWTGISISHGNRHTITGNEFTLTMAGGDPTGCAVKLNGVIGGAAITGNHGFAMTGNSATGAPIMLLNNTHGVIVSGNSLWSATAVGYVDGSSTSNSAWSNLIGSGTPIAIGFTSDNTPFIVGSNTALGSRLNVNGATATTKGVMLLTTGTFRWQMMADGSSETGSNAGSNFAIQRFDDAGASLGTPFSIARTTGLVTANAGLMIGSATAVNTDLAINGPITQFRLTTYQTAGSVRWRTGANTAAEGGGNAGSDFVFRRYDDTGTFISQPLVIARSTGNALFGSSIGVWNTTPPVAKPAVSGSRGGNAALASLITALASYGLITDSSTV